MPLRKGSKSIPGKNHKLFYGKPLFTWYLDTVIQSECADEIWVATDCDVIKSMINNITYSSVKIFNRSSENAQDTSPTIDVVLEFLTTATFPDNDNFILIQATSPLTPKKDIKNLAQKLRTNEKTSYVACTRLKRFRWSENGTPLDYTMDKKPRRQDYAGFLVETGAFYASKVGAILSTRQLLSGDIDVIELGSEALIDIDELLDWHLGEACLRYFDHEQTSTK